MECLNQEIVYLLWVKEEGKWVVKTSHYSPAQFGGVHITVATDFDN